MKIKKTLSLLALTTVFSLPFIYFAIYKAGIRGVIHAYSIRLADITSPQTDNSGPLTFNGNDFTLRLERLKAPLNVNKTAGIILNSKNELEVYEQSDALKILAQYKIDTHGRTVEETLLMNGGIKRIFKFDSNLIGLFTFINKNSNCYHASLINLTLGIEFMRGDCLPEINGIDFNGIGGGHAILNNKLLVAIGTPTTDYSKISSLAQDLNSHYGKILEFSKRDILIPFNHSRRPNIFSYGHRNPQGLINFEGQIFGVEHGPKGGDELNLLEKGGNYGWPLNSFGSKYAGSAYHLNINKGGFISPIYTFIPSIGISNITNCPKPLVSRYATANCLLVSSLRANSIFVVLLNPINHSVLSVEQINIGMRVREFYEGSEGDRLYISSDGQGIYQLSFTDIAQFIN